LSFSPSSFQFQPLNSIKHYTTSKHREEQKERKEKRKAMLAEMAARDKALKTLIARQKGGTERATIPKSKGVQASILIQTPTLPLDISTSNSESAVVEQSSKESISPRPTSPCLYSLLAEIWETPYTIVKEEYDLWDSLVLLDEAPTATPTPIALTISVIVATPGREEAEDMLGIHPTDVDMMKEEEG
jgi:hypothetical protein